jgi:branched-chain amino acid transport system substrate-binding protein
MKLSTFKALALAVSAVAALACGGAAMAQAKAPAKAPAKAAAGGGEQFFPVLSYRTGAYGPNGTQWADGYVDYLKLINARDGGINGVKITFEECEFGYDTARGVECYERLKSKPFPAMIQPLSTGVTFALTDKTAVDKIPLVTIGYGRADSVEGEAFPYNFPMLGTYWDTADVMVQHAGKLSGGMDKLKGKKIALVYHDSPYGKEPITLLQERAKMLGFQLLLLPVTHPGVEQKATWLQIRQQRPDYVFLWGWGVMNAAALKEAIATGYPRDKMIGNQWSSSETDVASVAADVKGYMGLALQHGPGRYKVHEDILKLLYGKGQGTGPKEGVGTVLYNRGLVSAMLGVEGVRQAQTRYGKKPLTGEQIRWGLETLDLDQKRLDALGIGTMIRPISTSCRDHGGSHAARIMTWDGTKWNFSSDWYEADQQIIRPIIERSAAAYLAEKKIPRRDCAKELTAK